MEVLPGVVVLTCNPSTREAKAGGWSSKSVGLPCLIYQKKKKFIKKLSRAALISLAVSPSQGGL
jgi:hypothetical protein